MRKNCIALIIAGATVLTGVALAQTQAAQDAAAPQTATSTEADTQQTTTPAAPAPQQAPAPAAAPAATPTPSPSPLTRWGMDFSFLFDGYTDANFNSPDSGFNQLRNFDVRSDTLHVNMGKMTIDRAPGPVGFHLDVGFGQTFDIIHSTNNPGGPQTYFEQAYLSLKPKSWKGVEVDAGEFVTAAGAEVIETNQNWNYSRSLLFALAIPYYHFGIRTSFPIGSHFTGGVQLVRGWNNMTLPNGGVTMGFNGAYAWKKVTWTNVYYGGPESEYVRQGWRQLYDTTVQVNQTDNFSYYINFDYGHQKYAGAGAGAANWSGVAGAARYALSKKLAIAGRAEFFNDMDGYTTGTKQQLKEVTLTGEYKWTGWLMTRCEFRSDFSDQYYFQHHGGTTKSQPTVLLGLVASVGPKK
jgi:hypothetical protein